MKKSILAAAATVLACFMLSGCVIYSVRPDYSGTEDTTAVVSETYQGGVTAYVPDYYTLRIVNNTWVFYMGGEEVSVWIYYPDGSCIKRGAPINGAVRMFYAPDRMAAEFIFRNNIRSGSYKTYWNNGTLRETGTYDQDKKTGNWRAYYENGTLYRNEDYSSGRRSRVIFTGKKPLKTGKTEWDWSFVDKADNAKNFKEEPFEKNKKYYNENEMNSRYGEAGPRADDKGKHGGDNKENVDKTDKNNGNAGTNEGYDKWNKDNSSGENENKGYGKDNGDQDKAGEMYKNRGNAQDNENDSRYNGNDGADKNGDNAANEKENAGPGRNSGNKSYGKNGNSVENAAGAEDNSVQKDTAPVFKNKGRSKKAGMIKENADQPVVEATPEGQDGKTSGKTGNRSFKQKDAEKKADQAGAGDGGDTADNGKGPGKGKKGDNAGFDNGNGKPDKGKNSR